MTAMDPGSSNPGNGSPGPASAAALGVSEPPLDWGTTLAEHGRWLRTIVRSRLGEDQGVDEVMQDVSLAAVAQRAPVEEPSRLGAWLYRVAVRQCLMHRRRLGRHRKLVDRYARAVSPSEVADGPPADPLRWLVAQEQGRRVREAVANLPDTDRDLFLLKYTEDWTYRDLARHLGLTESAVEARLHRIRRRLRAVLAEPADS
jgi:RNA polymerase sigma-70 factor (ECF subfamily)